MASRGSPDWREAGAYAPLLAIDRGGWAWEWLRRDPAYRRAAARAARGAAEDPARWGLHRFEDPRRGAHRARPLWTAAASAFVLEIHGEPVRWDGLDLVRLASADTAAPTQAGRTPLLVADGRAALRIDLVSGAKGPGRPELRLSPAGPGALAAQLAALGQFHHLWRKGRLAPQPLSRARALRNLKLLRVADALAAGAAQRQIAEHLFDTGVAQPRWRIERPTVRLQVQRLVRQARVMAAGFYRTLLEGQD